jgi:hypothetical protein
MALGRFVRHDHGSLLIAVCPSSSTNTHNLKEFFIMTTKSLTVSQRKSIFHALVESQDSGVPVQESKKKVAADYHLSREQLDLIEKEGVDKDWPPLT